MSLGELLEAARETRGEVIRLTGREKHSGEPVSALYVGMTRCLDYLVDRLFIQHSACREAGGLSMWTAPRRAREACRSVDLVIAELPWPYYRMVRPEPFLRVPPWIEQSIPIPDTWPAVVGGMRRSGRATILRRIRRFDLSFTVTTRRADLERFYDSMYEPHARRRFGHLAVVADRDEVVAPGAALLQVVQGDRVVSAGVVCQSENALCCLWDGVADGLGPDLAEAASGGLYYFQIQRAWAQGCREVNLGYTRPLLNDGVYWYKRKWGAGVHDVWRERELLLRPTRLGAGVESFFVHDPLIVRQNHRLVGKIMTDRDLLSRAYVAPLVR